MVQETEQNPEMIGPIGEARAVYQEYVDFWQKNPSPGSQEWQKKLTVITKMHGEENQAKTAEDLARFNVECGCSYPAVFFLELTDLGEKEKWQMLAQSIEREAQKSTQLAERHRKETTFVGLGGKEMIFETDEKIVQSHKAKASELRPRAEVLRKGIDALT
jgi:hypothetical protein